MTRSSQPRASRSRALPVLQLKGASAETPSVSCSTRNISEQRVVNAAHILLCCKGVRDPRLSADRHVRPRDRIFSPKLKLVGRPCETRHCYDSTSKPSEAFVRFDYGFGHTARNSSDCTPWCAILAFKVEGQDGPCSKYEVRSDSCLVAPTVSFSAVDCSPLASLTYLVESVEREGRASDGGCLALTPSRYLTTPYQAPSDPCRTFLLEMMIGNRQT